MLLRFLQWPHSGTGCTYHVIIMWPAVQLMVMLEVVTARQQCITWVPNTLWGHTYIRMYVCMYIIRVCTLANHEACPGTGSKVDWSTHTHSHTVWTYLHTYTRLHVHIRMFVGRWIQWPANNSRNVYRSTHQERNSWHKLQALVVIQAESPAFSEAKKCFSPLQMTGFMQPPVKVCEVS